MGVCVCVCDREGERERERERERESRWRLSNSVSECVGIYYVHGNTDILKYWHTEILAILRKTRDTKENRISCWNANDLWVSLWRSPFISHQLEFFHDTEILLLHLFVLYECELSWLKPFWSCTRYFIEPRWFLGKITIQHYQGLTKTNELVKQGSINILY